MPYEQHVIAMSDFNYDSFKTILPARVKLSKILYPFRYEDKGFTPAEEIRRRYGLGLNDFVVLFNFDFRAELGRKAAASIREQFSIENFRKSVEAFLDA